MRRVYLDHNASSPLRPAALAVLRDWPAAGNPSSAHREGRLARRRLEDARETLADLVDCEPEALHFTSGGTEANAWALAGSRRPAVSPVEHPSVLDPARRRSEARVLPLDGRHGLDRRAATDALDGADLVSVGLANHETGRLQDVAALAEEHPDRGWLLHTDAAQAFGRIDVSFRALGVDLMTLSGHKLGGPPGVGALVVRRGLDLEPLLGGGPQEWGRRAGTEPALLACAWAAAAREARERRVEETARWSALLRELRDGISEIAPDAIFLSSEADCLPNTLCVAFPGRQGQTLVHRLDLEGVAVSHGSACASGSLEPSPVLLAMGCREDVARSSLRMSLGHAHAADDARVFVTRLRDVLAAVPRREPAQKKSATPHD